MGNSREDLPYSEVVYLHQLLFRGGCYWPLWTNWAGLSLCVYVNNVYVSTHTWVALKARPHWRVSMPVAGLICGRCSRVKIKGLALSQWRADTAKAEIIWESLHLQLKGHLWMTVLTSTLHLKNAMTMSAFILAAVQLCDSLGWVSALFICGSLTPFLQMFWG